MTVNNPIHVPMQVSVDAVSLPMEVSANAEELQMSSTPVVTRLENDYEHLVHRPSINGVELIGDKTTNDLHLGTTIFSQMSAAAEWDIVHNLGRRPSVTIVDSAGTVVIGDVQYLSDDRIVCRFNGAFSGQAYLN